MDERRPFVPFRRSRRSLCFLKHRRQIGAPTDSRSLWASVRYLARSRWAMTCSTVENTDFDPPAPHLLCLVRTGCYSDATVEGRTHQS